MFALAPAKLVAGARTKSTPAVSSPTVNRTVPRFNAPTSNPIYSSFDCFPIT
jgi:hypothetical protein